MKDDDDEYGGPHTEGGRRDMILFGRCLEQRDKNGIWRHIAYELWNPGCVPEADNASKPQPVDTDGEA